MVVSLKTVCPLLDQKNYKLQKFKILAKIFFQNVFFFCVHFAKWIWVNDFPNKYHYMVLCFLFFIPLLFNTFNFFKYNAIFTLRSNQKYFCNLWKHGFFAFIWIKFLCPILYNTPSIFKWPGSFWALGDQKFFSVQNSHISLFYYKLKLEAYQ